MGRWGERKTKPEEFACIFPPKSRLGGRESRGARPMEGSQRGERAGSLPPRLPESPRRTGAEKEGEARERRREGGREGEAGARERGRQFASEKRGKKHSRPNPARSQAVRKQQQKERERERASSPSSGARQPPDLPGAPPQNTVSSSRLRPPPNSPPSSSPPPFPKPKQHQGGWQKPPQTGRFTQRQQE